MPSVVRTGNFLGAYGLKAGGTITFDWQPDPRTFQDRILNVRDALEDRTAPLLAAGQFVTDDIRLRFKEQRDPAGEAWDEWSGQGGHVGPEGDIVSTVGYAAYAEQHNLGNILEQTLKLREAAVSPSRIRITENDLFYSTDGLPPYGLWHQEGKPDRRTASGSENPLPQRAFLGLSDLAAGEIMIVFSDWFDRSVSLYVTSRGRIGRRHALRGAGGRFVER